MNKAAFVAGVALASFAGTAVQAQEVVQWQAPVAVQTGQYSNFPMGTSIQLTTRTELNTKQHRPGDRFYLEVAEPLMYRGQVVVPVGSIAVGEVMRSERNGHFGKKGELEVRLNYLQTPSGPVRLSGRVVRSGRDQRLLSIGGAVVLLGWGPLLIHGTSGRLPADTPVTAYLADELRFPLSVDAAQASITVTPDPAARAERVLPARFDPSVFSSNRP